MAEAYGDQGGERKFEELISGGDGLWLAASTAASASGNIEGFCRLVPDEETRARRRACMDMLYIKEGARRDDLGRALIGAVREEASKNDFEGIWGYFNDSLGLDFLVTTGGRLLREIRLLRNERLDEVGRPKLPEGYRIRPLSPPDDLELASAIYNATFSQMWNFRPHTSEDIAEWFEGSDTAPEDCLILVYEGKSGARTFGAGIAVMAVDPARAKGPDPAAYVPDIGIAPSHRRLGLGGALMAAMAGRAREKGLAAIELIADDRDSAVKAFYGKLGFDEMGIIIVYEW
jgi:ribosomal protein S18 acetylase RimI-like enzyme